MKIWANTLVKNEERYIWFSVMSVIEHVEKIIIWDTGSTDNTVKIINEIEKKYPEKVVFKKVIQKGIHDFTKIRQQMLDQTNSDWMLILDGDEVWWDEGIQKVVEKIKNDGNGLESIVNTYYNLVGDIYHYQDESAGRYSIDNKVGHLTIRAMNRKIPGLKVDKPHGIQGFYDKNGKLIQERILSKRLHINEPAFLHLTHLQRSSNVSKDKKVPKREKKLKLEIGKRFSKDFYYPEIFFRPRPDIVPSPWQKMSKRELILASILTPARRVKRVLIKSPVGY